ncbi:formylmethanofuran dehydrogenase subunit E [Spirochaetia bacterium]|nr:formylmethanofuran dehydrogenase subunit E [Spirochaetia bacterium]
MYRTFEEDLSDAVKYHGHLCPGQLMGVRLARYGCKLLGIENPREYRDLITYVENDRCLADAISTVTGCKLGKRCLKYKDFGKGAATFLDIASNKAIRLYLSDHRKIEDGADIVSFFSNIKDEELFTVQHVKINLEVQDMPGKPCEKVICAICGEMITDKRQVIKDDKVICKSCAGESYYSLA